MGGRGGVGGGGGRGGAREARRVEGDKRAKTGPHAAAGVKGDLCWEGEREGRREG